MPARKLAGVGILLLQKRNRRYRTVSSRTTKPLISKHWRRKRSSSRTRPQSYGLLRISLRLPEDDSISLIRINSVPWSNIVGTISFRAFRISFLLPDFPGKTGPQSRCSHHFITKLEPKARIMQWDSTGHHQIHQVLRRSTNLGWSISRRILTNSTHYSAFHGRRISLDPCSKTISCSILLCKYDHQQIARSVTGYCRCWFTQSCLYPRPAITYVALSRATNVENLSVLLPHERGEWQKILFIKKSSWRILIILLADKHYYRKRA